MGTGLERNRVNEIDLLRLMAALAVVFFHYAFRGYAADGMSIMPYPALAPVAKYGFLGVHLFFMISGFVILMTAANGSLKDFLISRIVRLYPAFWACCSLTFIVILFFGGRQYSATFSQYAINLTMLNGFVGVPSIDGAYWSLFVEMKFYALVALVLLLGRIRQVEFFLAGWLLASLMLELFPNGKLRSLLVADYAVYFIAGANCFLIWSKGMSWQRGLILFISWVFSGFQMLKSLNGFEKYYHEALNPVLSLSIVSLFFVVMILVALRKTGAFGERRWLMAGALTYPLYLVHQNIGFMIFNYAYPALSPHLLLWSAVLLMLVIAYAVNRWVERKLAPVLKAGLMRLFRYKAHV